MNDETWTDKAARAGDPTKGFPAGESGEASAHPLYRRKKILLVPNQYVADLFSRGLLSGEYVNVPEPVGLPTTARVMGVWADYHTDSFAILIEDASFDKIAEACEYPKIEVTWRTVRRKIHPVEVQPKQA